MNIPPFPRVGDLVKIVQKKDYSSGKLTEGTVKRVLTKKKDHPRGAKVQLTNGFIGRVQVIVGPSSLKRKSEKEDSYFDDSEALI